MVKDLLKLSTSKIYGNSLLSVSVWMNKNSGETLKHSSSFSNKNNVSFHKTHVGNWKLNLGDKPRFLSSQVSNQ